MWSAGAEPLDLFVGARMAALCCGAELLGRSDVDGFDAGLRVAAQWLSAPSRRRKVRVWIGGAVCPLLFVSAMDPAISARSRQDVARSLARKALGPSPELRLWLDEDGPDDELFGAGMTEGHARAIEALIRSSPHALRSMAPWWSEALRAALSMSKGGVAVVLACDSDVLVKLSGNDGRFKGAAMVTLPTGQHERAQLLARARAGADDEADGSVVVVELQSKTGSGKGALPMALAPLVRIQEVIP